MSRAAPSSRARRPAVMVRGPPIMSPPREQTGVPLLEAAVDLHDCPLAETHPGSVSRKLVGVLPTASESAFSRSTLQDADAARAMRKRFHALDQELVLAQFLHSDSHFTLTPPSPRRGAPAVCFLSKRKMSTASSAPRHLGDARNVHGGTAAPDNPHHPPEGRRLPLLDLLRRRRWRQESSSRRHGREIRLAAARPSEEHGVELPPPPCPLRVGHAVVGDGGNTHRFKIRLISCSTATAGSRYAGIPVGRRFTWLLGWSSRISTSLSRWYARGHPAAPRPPRRRACRCAVHRHRPSVFQGKVPEEPVQRMDGHRLVGDCRLQASSQGW